MTELHGLDEPDDLPEDDANLSVLAANGKHASLWTLTEWMHRILAQRVAERLLAGDLPDYGALFVPESFGWMYSKIDAGRKEIGPDGGRLTLPVRLEWSEPVAILTQNTELAWGTASMGHLESGACKVVLDELRHSEDEHVDRDEHGIPVAAVVAVDPEHVLRRRLQVVVDEGKQAYWEMLQTMEPRVKLMLRRAHVGVSRDICEFQGMPDRLLLDETALEAVVTDFILGTGDEIGKLRAIIEKILTPASMHRVDPLRYINRAIRRDAAEAIRRQVGDPRIGRKIRSVSKDLDVRDVAAVVEAMRDLYPKDKVSTDRVVAALSVQPDPMSGRWSTSHADGSESEFAGAPWG